MSIIKDVWIAFDLKKKYFQEDSDDCLPKMFLQFSKGISVHKTCLVFVVIHEI